MTLGRDELSLLAVGTRVVGRVMTDYRFYRIDPRAKVFTAPTVLQCRNDDEALLQGQSLVSDFPVEIWDGGRRVGTLGLEQFRLGQ